MYIIGLGEYAISESHDESITTHALGSCVALIIHCKLTKCTGMAHIVLPKYDTHHDLFHKKEAYFADVIAPKMIDYFLSRRFCNKKGLEITLIGGAEAKDHRDMFKVGQRNMHEIEGILHAYGLSYNKEETGGRFSRSVTVQVADGSIDIRKNKMLL